MAGINSDVEYGQLITGLITAVSQTVDFSNGNNQTEAVQITGTWVGTFIFEATVDNLNWFTINALNLATFAQVSTTTANGNFLLTSQAFSATRIRASAWTSGTATIDNSGTDTVGLPFAFQGGTWNLNNITGIVSLPTGAATESTLAILDSKIRIDKSAFIYGTNYEFPIGGVYQDTNPSLTAGQTGAFRSTQNRALHTNLRNEAGTEIGTISNPFITTNAYSNILYQSEFTITSRIETDIPGTTYTVAVGKTFRLMTFMASFDAQPTLYIRLKKQTGGSGSFNTIFRINLEVGGQGQSSVPFVFPNGVLIGNAGDVFKLTVESTLVKGNLWSGYSGVES